MTFAVRLQIEQEIRDARALGLVETARALELELRSGRTTR